MSKNIEGSTFSCDGKTLWRSVEPSRTDRGQKSYKHSCTRDTFESICLDIEDVNGGFTGEDIQNKGDYPFSQVSTAMAFLEERGIIETRGRMRIAVGPVHLYGMMEFHALHEE
mgnify:CR=1 FL=1